MKPDFSSCIRPLSPDEFMAEYRSKQPAFFSGTSDKYLSLIDIPDLNRMLSTTILAQGTVRIRRPDGGQLPLDEISTPVDGNRDRRTIRPGLVERSLKAGATLTVEHCECFFDDVREMCHALAGAFQARVYATLFLVYEPDRPCGLHWDDRDMFICQMKGRKMWPLYKPLYENPLFDQRRVTYKTPGSDLFQEYELRAGDGLYIPRGWLHNPAALDDSSMHVAFAIATPTAIDLLDWIRADLKDASAEMRGDLPIPLPIGQQREYAARLRETVMRSLSDEAIEAYYRRHMASVAPLRVELAEIRERETANT